MDPRPKPVGDDPESLAGHIETQREQLGQNLQELRQQLSGTIQQAQTKVEDAGERAQERVRETAERVQDKVHGAKDRVEHVKQQVKAASDLRTWVRKQPLVVAGAVFAVSFWLGSRSSGRS